MSVSAFRDVAQYPRRYLYTDATGVHVPTTYRRVWDDGFGARGWKIDVSIGDPEIIASTRETGSRVETSVFVHDILDHLLSGFGVSGHRSEAMALAQLALRTASDIRSDFEQMVKEDLMKGRVNGENIREFIGPDLVSQVPAEVTEGRDVMGSLVARLGEAQVIARRAAR